MGRILSVAFVCLGSGDGEQIYPGLWFLPVGMWESQTPCCCCCCIVRDGWTHRSLLLLFGVWGQVVSLFSLRFVPLSFGIYFLEILKPAWFWRCGGQHYWKRVILGGLPAHNVVEDVLCYPVLSFVTVGYCVIGRP